MSKIEDSKNAPKRFRKKPVTVEAMRFDGTTAEAIEVYRWIEENTAGSYDTNDPSGEVPGSGVSIDAATGFLVIATLEGEMVAKPGDWVIRGIAGEFYPCKPDIFEATYEAVEEGEDEMEGLVCNWCKRPVYLSNRKLIDGDMVWFASCHKCELAGMGRTRKEAVFDFCKVEDVVEKSVVSEGKGGVE